MHASWAAAPFLVAPELVQLTSAAKASLRGCRTRQRVASQLSSQICGKLRELLTISSEMLYTAVRWIERGMAFWNSAPLPSYSAIWLLANPPPPDWPEMAMFLGSPPNLRPRPGQRIPSPCC